MKAPNLPSFSESWPVPQVGQVRGLEPSPLSGKMCGPRSSFRASRTSRRAQLLRLADGGREVAPEFAQDLLPVDLVVRDAIELLFEVGGEVEFHVAAEEGLEEGDDDAALVLGHEALLFDPHIFPVAQRLKDRRVGRRAPDAELFHALDEARLREARRRFGEMLGRGDAAAARADRPPSSAAAGPRPRPRRRPCPLDRGSGSRRTSRPGRWREGRAGAGRPALRYRRSCVRVLADSIWLATVRIQISS